jgi:hypothetical protein
VPKGVERRALGLTIDAEGRAWYTSADASHRPRVARRQIDTFGLAR